MSKRRQKLDHDEERISCSLCGADREWEDCWRCGGDGFLDCYDEDPVNLSPDEEVEPCPECRGRGGYLVCPNVPHGEEEEDDG